MNSSPTEILREACSILDPVMKKNGFSFQEDRAGRSSGGPNPSGTRVNADRRLEIPYRFSLGLLTYHYGQESMEHALYMRVLVGENGGNRYPGFSDDPFAAFHGLAYDLDHIASALLKGDFKEFARCVVAAEEWKKIPGLARLP